MNIFQTFMILSVAPALVVAGAGVSNLVYSSASIVGPRSVSGDIVRASLVQQFDLPSNHYRAHVSRRDLSRLRLMKRAKLTRPARSASESDLAQSGRPVSTDSSHSKQSTGPTSQEQRSDKRSAQRDSPRALPGSPRSPSTQATTSSAGRTGQPRENAAITAPGQQGATQRGGPPSTSGAQARTPSDTWLQQYPKIMTGLSCIGLAGCLGVGGGAAMLATGGTSVKTAGAMLLGGGAAAAIVAPIGMTAAYEARRTYLRQQRQQRQPPEP